MDHRLLIAAGFLVAAHSVGCNEGDNEDENPRSCIEETRPCSRTEICEEERCRAAPRAEDASECPPWDADGDRLFFEFGFCVEACQPGPLWCPPPEFVCHPEQRSCVRADRECLAHDDCARDEVCRSVALDLLTGQWVRRCVSGMECVDDDACGSLDPPGRCDRVQGVCVACVEDGDCTAGEACDRMLKRCQPVPPQCQNDGDCCEDAEPCPEKCEEGRCVAPSELPECDDENPCPIDQGCDAGVCVSDECSIHQDCFNFQVGGYCDLRNGPDGFGLCMEPDHCVRQGQPSTCRDARVCDHHDSGGWSCQERCGAERTCPNDTLCDSAGSGLCIGSGLCMTSETCQGHEACAVVGVTAVCQPCEDCCRSHDDCPASMVCQGVSCRRAPPDPCSDDAQCAGNQTCDGVCTLRRPCQGSADCAVGETCDTSSGRCGQCREDADCQDAGLGVRCGWSQSGSARRCYEADGPCTTDGDCVGRRACVEGACEPANCTDDWLHNGWAPGSEPFVGPRGNHSIETATPISPRILDGLRLCDGRDDFFVFAAGPGQSITATLEFNHFASTYSDLSLTLLGDGLTVRSDGSSGREVIEVNARTGGIPSEGDDRAFWLHVEGPAGAEVNYRLSLYLGERCEDDPFEGDQGNTGMEHAQGLELGRSGPLIVCAPEDPTGSADDWYLLPVGPPGAMVVDTSWDANDGQLQVSIVDAQGGSPAMETTDTPGRRQIRIAEGPAGPLWLVVEAAPENTNELRYFVDWSRL